MDTIQGRTEAAARVTTVRFEYGDGEYARALRRYRLRQFHVRRDLAACVLLISAGYFLLNRTWPFWLIAGSAPLYLVIASLSVGVFPAIAVRLRPYLAEPYSLAFSSQDIRFSTPSTASTLPWSIYQAWSRDPDYAYLSLGRGHATILPRRALGGPAAEAALFRLFDEKIGAEQAAG